MFRSFLFKLLGLTAVLAGGNFFILPHAFFEQFRGFVWLSLGFLALSTLVVYLIIARAMTMQSQRNFVAAFGTAFAFKAFGALVFLAYFIFINPISDHNFIFPFFAYYFIYTGLLMWQVWTEQKG